MCTRPAIRTSRPIRATSPVRRPLGGALAELDPANAAYYQARYKAFAERWNAAIAEWEKQAAPLRGTPILVQHKAFTYLEVWLGLNAGRGTRTQAGRRTDHRASHGGACDLTATAGQDGDPRRLPERPRVAVDRRAREDQRRDAAVHRRRRRSRRRTSTACSTTRSRVC